MNEDIKLFTGEAIQAIKDNKPTSGYKVLNKALDMAIEALQKQEPENPIIVNECSPSGTCGWTNWFCPECNHRFGVINHPCKDDYCPNCGQRIDWSEQEENK